MKKIENKISSNKGQGLPFETIVIIIIILIVLVLILYFLFSQNSTLFDSLRGITNSTASTATEAQNLKP